MDEPELTEIENEMRETMKEWIADGETIIAIFENREIGHHLGGMRFGMAYDVAREEEMVVGKMRAPDTKHGLGWRYILVAKTRSADDALDYLCYHDDPNGN